MDEIKIEEYKTEDIIKQPGITVMGGVICGLGDCPGSGYSCGTGCGTAEGNWCGWGCN